ncbi:hypothetical protein GCM10008910_37640 [Faecalicatena orotica]|uniref:tRNA (Uracil-5-)-methyltransferase n=1 Tax=Faecalicatena orotica TaxID=1544 RepID=A0A2Y9BBE5_9FIRM|nr:tRNA (uracil-5-)-methyltransferase [Faecalicatena orotica]PWJ30228.1 hypothetical protein A8806_10495 [Faecalicatena orotica]SSA55217.1 hypothetical protein SAMN05216536_10495 [Faecalicatena orotica]
MKQKKDKKIWKTALLIFLAGLLVGGGVYLGMKLSDGADKPAKSTGAVDSDAEDWQGVKEPEKGGESAGIAIPGFKSMTFRADEMEQAVNLYNPEVNDCYFIMTLLLPDGTELWKSDLVKPGKGFYTITLNQSLEAGSYPDSTLKYQCYMMNDEQTELNGSEVKFELIVE